MGVDTTAMTGVETGARAGAGSWTGMGNEAEIGIWAEIEGAKAGVGVVMCVWTGGGVVMCVWAGGGVVMCVWVGVDVRLKPCVGVGMGGKTTAVWVCVENKPGVSVDTWFCTDVETAVWAEGNTDLTPC